MKVGSLVECVKNPDINPLIQTYAKIDWVPVKGEIYTVREIFKNVGGEKELLIKVEEHIIGYNRYTDSELGVPIDYFREVQPPIENVIKDLIEECQTELV